MQVKGPKTEAGYRTVALEPIVIAALRRLRAEQAERRLILGVDYHDEDLVICKPDGRPYRPDSTSSQFRKFVDSIGLPKTVHVHTLRHSAASSWPLLACPPPISPPNSAIEMAGRSLSGSMSTRSLRGSPGLARTSTK